MSGSRIELKAFVAELQCLYEMLAFIREESERAGFDPHYISKIELAAEEALVNIINYAYLEITPNTLIDVECSEMIEGGIKIIIRDQGVPYNPLEYKSAQTAKATVEERAIGGYGIFFMLNLMDKVEYCREENSNVLTLIKFKVR